MSERRLPKVVHRDFTNLKGQLLGYASVVLSVMLLVPLSAIMLAKVTAALTAQRGLTAYKYGKGAMDSTVGGETNRTLQPEHGCCGDANRCN
jgi:hypothetical protein